MIIGDANIPLMTTNIRLKSAKFLVLISFISVFFGVLPSKAEGAGLTSISDTISTSVPGAGANHVVKFTVTNTVPASGKIIITPQAGAFTMPAGLDYTDIDFLDDGADQTLSVFSGSGSGGAIGVSIITGTSSIITLTLNNTDALDIGSVITIKIGANAAFGETGDQQVQNPAIAGSYKINIKTYNSFNDLIDQADAMAAILLPVQIGTLPEVVPEVAPVPVSEPASAPSPLSPIPSTLPTPLVPSPVVPEILPPKITPEIVPKITPEIIPKITPEIVPKITPEPILKSALTPLPIPTPKQIIEAQTAVAEFITAAEITASPEVVSVVTKAMAQTAALGTDMSTISADTITAIIRAV